MSWDPKSERITAKSQADLSAAQAEALRAQTALQFQAAADEREAKRRAARSHECRERKAKRKQDRQERRAKRAEKHAAVVSAVRRYAVPVAAIGSPEVIAWSGQYGFAARTMKLGVLSPLLPVALEGGVLYTATLALQAIDADKPAGKYRAATWVQAGIAAAMNYWHGSAGTGGDQVGVALALTSLLGIAMLELTVALKQHKAGGRTAIEIRRALIRRMRYPLLSAQAAAIGAAQGLDVEAAWRAAWIDRYGIGPNSTRRERRTAKAILNRQERADRKRAKAGDLVIADGAIVERSALSERADDDAQRPRSSRKKYIAGGLAEIEQMLQETSAQGTTLDHLGGPRERSHRERMGAHDDTALNADERTDERSAETGDERSAHDRDERPAEKGERSRRPRRARKAIGRMSGGDRLAKVRELLTADPEMSGADIAKELRIPESTARRLRVRVLRERGERS
jgi:Protein of unknown function (DUF2637)